MLSLRSKSGHDEIVSASEIQTIAMAHASSLDAHKVHLQPHLSCNDYLCMCGVKFCPTITKDIPPRGPSTQIEEANQNAEETVARL
jgi:hypothetical protein